MRIGFRMSESYAICQDLSGRARLVMKPTNVRAPEAGEVRVRFVAAPVNMQDELVLRGQYPVRPSYAVRDDAVDANTDAEGAYPILGYDGAARVVECGGDVAVLQVGDLVVPKRHGLGTWRSDAVFAASELIRLPCDMDASFASLLKMVYTVAYLLVAREADVRPGDWLIINAATGRIAQAVVQFAQVYGIHTICVVRDDTDDKRMQQLTALGADVVVREMDASPEALASHAPIVLAIDSVFGASGKRLAWCLSTGGTFVSLGYLARESVPAADFHLPLTETLLFQRALSFRNFRLSERLKAWSDAQLGHLWVWFGTLHTAGNLALPPVHRVRFSAECLETITAAVEGKLREMHVRPLMEFDH